MLTFLAVVVSKQKQSQNCLVVQAIKEVFSSKLPSVSATWGKRIGGAEREDYIAEVDKYLRS